MSITRRTLLLSAAPAPSRSLNVVVVGGHPGDPECGCAGTIARYTTLGHNVTLLYLNRGEGYCGKGNSLDRCAGIRTKEAAAACQILKARSAFANQIDGDAIVDNSHYGAFAAQLYTLGPDVVFTHWPLDIHRDHRAASALTLDAYLKSTKKFGLYYYEVADDTLMYGTPSDYVDIAAVETQRRAACYSHASQQPEKWFPKQVEITRARGVAKGYAQAEAFLRYASSPAAFLP